MNEEELKNALEEVNKEISVFFTKESTYTKSYDTLRVRGYKILWYLKKEYLQYEDEILYLRIKQ